MGIILNGKESTIEDTSNKIKIYSTTGTRSTKTFPPISYTHSYEFNTEGFPWTCTFVEVDGSMQKETIFSNTSIPVTSESGKCKYLGYDETDTRILKFEVTTAGSEAPVDLNINCLYKEVEAGTYATGLNNDLIIEGELTAKGNVFIDKTTDTAQIIFGNGEDSTLINDITLHYLPKVDTYRNQKNLLYTIENYDDTSEQSLATVTIDWTNNTRTGTTPLSIFKDYHWYRIGFKNSMSIAENGNNYTHWFSLYYFHHPFNKDENTYKAGMVNFLTGYYGDFGSKSPHETDFSTYIVIPWARITEDSFVIYYNFYNGNTFEQASSLNIKGTTVINVFETGLVTEFFDYPIY